MDRLEEVTRERNSLSSKLKKAKKKILRLRRERDWLLDRLETLSGGLIDSGSDDDGLVKETDLESDNSQDSQDERAKEREKEKEKEKEKEREREKDKDKDKDKDKMDTEKELEKEEKIEKEKIPGSPQGTKESHKKTTVISKPSKKIAPYPVDSQGNPILPLKLGIITIVNLGVIIYDNQQFHNARYIYPDGFEVLRSYASTKNPEKMAVYTCRIKNVEGNIRFEVIPDDDPETIYHSPSATGAWTGVMKEANRVRGKDGSNSASGPDYFGFSQPTVVKLIQDLPNAKKCLRYVWQDIVVGDPPKKKIGKIEKEHSEEQNESPGPEEEGDELNVDD